MGDLPRIGKKEEWSCCNRWPTQVEEWSHCNGWPTQIKNMENWHDQKIDVFSQVQECRSNK